jgi:hypothetical protein
MGEGTQADGLSHLFRGYLAANPTDLRGDAASVNLFNTALDLVAQHQFVGVRGEIVLRAQIGFGKTTQVVAQ